MNYPFQSREYRTLFKNHFVGGETKCASYGETEYEILPDNTAVLLGMKKVLNGQEITDYGDWDLPDLKLAHADLKKNWGVGRVRYDYIREDSPAFQKLLGLTTPQRQEVSPFLQLPVSWDTYLESLERTDRKELKRKFKRLDTVRHEYRYAKRSEADDEAFREFVSLHKLSAPEKDAFMTAPMEKFFHDLYALAIPGWTQKIATLIIEDKTAASVFYFESDTSILLYNSGFDPQQKFYSAGLLLIATLIRDAITAHKTGFDFLRGNERYKYDLGGKDVTLSKFESDL